jgi:WD40 repeat protein
MPRTPAQAAVGSHDHTLKLWDLATGEERRAFTGHTQAVDSLAIAPDGRTALSGSSDTTLKAIGDNGKTNTLFLSHAPGSVKDISEQIIQSVLGAEKAKS